MANNSSGGCACLVYTFMAIISAVFAWKLNYGILTLFFVIWDFCFWPLAWIKWLICGQITRQLFEQVFPFLF